MRRFVAAALARVAVALAGLVPLLLLNSVLQAQDLQTQNSGAAAAEVAKNVAALQQQMLARFDANRDGVLSDQEKLQAQEFMRRQGVGIVGGFAPGGFPGAADFLKQFDADGDGQLSNQEKMLAQAAYQRMRAKSGVSAGAGPHTTGAFPPGGFPAGANGAGVGPNPVQPNAEKEDKRGGLLKRFDKDGDGKLNAEEKAALQAEYKAKSKTKTTVKDGAAKKTTVKKSTGKAAKPVEKTVPKSAKKT
jgi:hypothetical protein